MRLLTSKDSDLFSCFDNNAETPLNDNNLLKKRLLNIYAYEKNKGKIKGQLPSEQILGFCKSFKKV